MDLGLSGLVSGLDWRTLVDKLADVERVPANRLRAEQTTLQQQNTAYTTLKTQLSALQSRITLLQDPTLFDSRQSVTSDAAIASAVAGGAAALGAYNFNFIQLATAARQMGAPGAGSSLSATSDVSALVLSEAAFASSITSGTFTTDAIASDISTTAGAATALTNIRAAITQLSTDRATIGAYQSRLNFISEELTISKENLTAASSRIQDVDVAEESTQFAKANILVQSGTAMLAQANALPQSVLKLLQ